MLDRLVESKNSARENKRLGSFLLPTFGAIVSTLIIGLVYSLFSQTLAMGGEDLDLSVLAAPITVAEQEPQPVKPQIKQEIAENSSIKLPTRQDIIQRTDEAPRKTPDAISVTKNTQMARPDGRNFMLGKIDTNPPASGSIGSERGNSEIGTSLSNSRNSENEAEKIEIEKPPVIKQQPKIVPKAANRKPVSLGVINGEAKNLVKPIYSPAARAVQAKGQVKVQVLIDEDGNVISANAVSGHPLLQSEALKAARASKFSPTYLSGDRVKVTGFIVYNFEL